MKNKLTKPMLYHNKDKNWHKIETGQEILKKRLNSAKNN